MSPPGRTRRRPAGPEGRPPRTHLAVPWSLLLVACCAVAQGASATIYTCIDASGKRLTADRPIPECNHREQYRLNRDGSVQAVIGPVLTADERAVAEAAEQRAARDRAARLDATRRDRNLLQRFPDEAKHQHAREAALAVVSQAMQASEKRIASLTHERRDLLQEAEFYQGRLLPLPLQMALDANGAGLEAQRSLLQNQRAEEVRINALFDAELDRLRRLWAGAMPGSLGALPSEAAASQSSRPAARR